MRGMRSWSAASEGAIDTGMVLKCIEPIWQEKPATANRVRGRVERVLDWATVRAVIAREITRPAGKGIYARSCRHRARSPRSRGSPPADRASAPVRRRERARRLHPPVRLHIACREPVRLRQNSAGRNPDSCASLVLPRGIPEPKSSKSQQKSIYISIG
jgi:hypothetical protein